MTSWSETAHTKPPAGCHYVIESERVRMLYDSTARCQECTSHPRTSSAKSKIGYHSHTIMFTYTHTHILCLIDRTFSASKRKCDINIDVEEGHSGMVAFRFRSGAATCWAQVNWWYDESWAHSYTHTHTYRHISRTRYVACTSST